MDNNCEDILPQEWNEISSEFSSDYMSELTCSDVPLDNIDNEWYRKRVAKGREDYRELLEVEGEKMRKQYGISEDVRFGFVSSDWKY